LCVVFDEDRQHAQWSRYRGHVWRAVFLLCSHLAPLGGLAVLDVYGAHGIQDGTTNTLTHASTHCHSLRARAGIVQVSVDEDDLKLRQAETWDMRSAACGNTARHKGDKGRHIATGRRRRTQNSPKRQKRHAGALLSSTTSGRALPRPQRGGSSVV